jgi:hypothetical protein
MQRPSTYVPEAISPRSIYCRSELSGEAGDDVWIPSLEHIVPFSMGGLYAAPSAPDAHAGATRSLSSRIRL